jgi:hypothetical protein
MSAPFQTWWTRSKRCAQVSLLPCHLTQPCSLMLNYSVHERYIRECVDDGASQAMRIANNVVMLL